MTATTNSNVAKKTTMIEYTGSHGPEVIKVRKGETPEQAYNRINKIPTLIPLSEQRTPEEEQSMTATKTAPKKTTTGNKPAKGTKANATSNGKASKNGKPHAEANSKTTTSNTKPEVNGKTKKNSNGISDNKLKVLTILSKSASGMTRAEMVKKTGIAKGWSKMLGAVTKEDAGTGTLEGDGLVKSAKIEDSRGLVYTITAAGRKLVLKLTK